MRRSVITACAAVAAARLVASAEAATVRYASPSTGSNGPPSLTTTPTVRSANVLAALQAVVGTPSREVGSISALATLASTPLPDDTSRLELTEAALQEMLARRTLTPREVALSAALPGTGGSLPAPSDADAAVAPVPAALVGGAALLSVMGMTRRRSAASM